MFRLVFHLSAEAEQPIPLPEAGALTLGRGEDAAIRLEHATVSRLHARLTPGPDGVWTIEDLGSSNGVRLNGGARLKRVEPLKPGDRLAFGDVAATFRHATPAEQAEDAARDAAAEPAVGRTFATRYRIQATAGGTHEYDGFRALDLSHENRPVALKIFRPGAVEAGGGFRAMAERFDAFQATPAQPNLDVLLDFACWREASYLVARWTDGHPLTEVLQRPRRLTIHEILRFARQAAATTTHARAHRLPSPDLNPQTMRIAFQPPPPKPGEWAKLLDKAVGRWPDFLLKITPCLGLPESGYSFGTLLCELLGAPPATTVPGARPVPVQIPALGERGNEVLARGLTSRGEAFGGDAAFVEVLHRATDPRAYR